MKLSVTGIGVVAPNGQSVEPFWESLCAGRPTLGEPLDLPGTGLVAAEVTSADWLTGIAVSSPAALDRCAQFAVVAAGEALAMAGLRPGDVPPERVAIVVGNGAGGQVSMDAQFKRVYRHDQIRTHPLTIAKAMVSSPASWISIAYRFKGPTFVVASACASGTHAVGIAASLVASGLVDVAVCGGTEAPLAYGTVRAWASMRILAPDACRPFSLNRRGLVLGEGAGMLVIENAAHAAARGAKCLATLAGFSSCADAGDIFQPSADGMGRAMKGAIADAGLSPAEIGYVNAHGTGTAANDVTETQALKAVFGAATCPPMSSNKAVTGHGLGASGAIEAVASVLTLSRRVLPPTANHDAPDPACDLDCIPNIARQQAVSAVLSNSFAFGGLNASLVFTA